MQNNECAPSPGPDRIDHSTCFILFYFTREHILNSYCMKEEADMTDYS